MTHTDLNQRGWFGPFATVATAAVIALIVLTSPAISEELRGSQSPSTSEPNSAAQKSAKSDNPDLRGSVLGFRAPKLHPDDRRAALGAVQTALDEVGDGSTYVWYRRNNALTGLIRPIQSFQDRAGRICRKLQVTLMAGPATRTVYGKACRDSAGVWSLERSG